MTLSSGPILFLGLQCTVGSGDIEAVFMFYIDTGIQYIFRRIYFVLDICFSFRDVLLF